MASWLVDVSHVELERCRRNLLDVRDVLQGAAGRATDRVAPELWGELAVGLQLEDESAAQVHVRELGTPDRPPVPADLAPRRRRARQAGLGDRRPATGA